MNKLEVKDILKDNKLPERWAKIRLGEIIIENIKSRFKVENADNSGKYPFFTSGEAILSDSNFLVDYENVFLATGGIANIKYYKGKANYSADTYCLKAKITTKYLYYFLLKNLTKIDYKYFSGSGLKHLQKNDFKKEILILPSSYYEQHKIAEILETVDETIEKTDAIIEKYKRIKQGLMQDLLTRGITAFEFEKDKIIVAIKKVFNDGDHKIGREENLVSHLSRHLDDFFPKWDIDSEVNKNKERQRPDIIVHKRGTDNNLFAIEVKKNDNLNAIKEDIKKLENVMLGDYYYEDVVFIGFDIENFEDVFKLSEKVNFILVSKNGEIKVKTRVRRFKESPLGRIPEEWEAYQIADVANVTKLAGFEFTNYFRYRDDGEIIALRALNIKNRKLDLTDIQRVKKEVSEQLPRSQVNAGDILITYIGAYIGDTLLIKESNKYHLAPNVAKITTKSIILPEFLEIFLSSYIGKKQYKQFSTLTATPSLTMTQIRKIIIFFPTEKEQHRIFSILSQIDKTIEREQKYKERLEKIKQGLMEDLLTGKLRVNHLIKEGVESV